MSGLHVFPAEESQSGFSGPCLYGPGEEEDFAEVRGQPTLLECFLQLFLAGFPGPGPLSCRLSEP